MCGEIDEQVLIGQEMQDRLRVMAKGMGVPFLAGVGGKDGASDDGANDGGAGDGGAGPVNLESAAGRAAYMDEIFGAGLARAVGDIARAQEDEKVDALAAQAIALARLAGVLAGQLPPEADLFRALIEAVSAGHAEPREHAEAMRRAQDHSHGHDHSHVHGHGHPHDHTTGQGGPHHESVPH